MGTLSDGSVWNRKKSLSSSWSYCNADLCLLKAEIGFFLYFLLAVHCNPETDNRFLKRLLLGPSVELNTSFLLL